MPDEQCGQAMQTSECPECGAVVGGSGHRLLASNTRDMELENIASQQGAAHNPFAIGL